MFFALALLTTVAVVFVLLKTSAIVPLTIKTRHVGQYMFLKGQPKLTHFPSLFRNKFNSHVRRFTGLVFPYSAFIVYAGNSVFGQLYLTELSQISYQLADKLKEQEFTLLESEAGDYLSIEFNHSALTPIHAIFASVKLRRFTKGQIVQCLQLRQGKRVTIVGGFKASEKAAAN